MMKKQSIRRQLLVLLVILPLAFLLTFLGLRAYFSDTRLPALLTRTFDAQDIRVQAGQAHLDKDSLVVDGTKPNDLSRLVIDGLAIDTQLYDTLTVVFAEKHSQQPLRVVLQHNASDRLTEFPVLYTNQMHSQFNLAQAFPKQATITHLELVTNKLLAPYRLRAIEFKPKHMTQTEFAHLLLSTFKDHQQRDAGVQVSMQAAHFSFLTAKSLLLIYFSVVGLLFAAYLYIAKLPMLNAWWLVLVLAWIVLDARYLLDKTATATETYQARQAATTLMQKAEQSTKQATKEKAEQKTATQPTNKLPQSQEENQ